MRLLNTAVWVALESRGGSYEKKTNIYPTCLCVCMHVWRECVDAHVLCVHVPYCVSVCDFDLFSPSLGDFWGSWRS